MQMGMVAPSGKTFKKITNAEVLALDMVEVKFSCRGIKNLSKQFTHGSKFCARKKSSKNQHFNRIDAEFLKVIINAHLSPNKFNEMNFSDLLLAHSEIY